MKTPFSLRLKVSILGLLSIFKQPFYIALAAIISFITLGVLLWSLNLDLLGYILVDSPLSLLEKMDFILDAYSGIATNYESFQSIIMVIFSVMFVLNLAALVFVVRGGQKQAIKSKSSVGGLAVAIVGGGCIACGTSIITPLLTSLGAVGSATLSSTIGLYLNLIGIALIIYSLLSLGQRAATIKAMNSKRS